MLRSLLLVPLLLSAAGATRLALAQHVDTVAVAAALADFRAACDAQLEPIWGRPLCGRLVLVDPASRLAFTAGPDPAREFRRQTGFFVGALPGDLPLANTAVDWGGERWAMVLLPLPEGRFDRLRLLAHESFHRLQPELGLPGGDPLNPHLDEAAGRTWLRLELRALSRALGKPEEQARAAVRDALLFRAVRRQLFPESSDLERRLELNEGLAEYTGARFALAAAGSDLAAVIELLRSYEQRPSFVRSFAYATGPGLGLLLDRFAPDWRARIEPEADLAAMLASALEFGAGDDVLAQARERGARYGYATVWEEEARRAAERAALIESYRERLVAGPVLLLRQQRLQRSFNPNELVPLGELGTVYPTGTFQADWGTLEVTGGGALVSPDFTRVSLPAPRLEGSPDLDVRVVEGSGWRLELAPGWSLRPGSRPGDLEAVPGV